MTDKPTQPWRREPLLLRFDDRRGTEIDRLLGSATRALRARGGSTVVIDLALAYDPTTYTAATRWLNRQRAVVAERVQGVAFVAHGWLAPTLLRFLIAGDPPPTAWTVVRSVEEALAWVPQREAGCHLQSHAGLEQRATREGQ